jgi:hypothetical protein
VTRGAAQAAPHRPCSPGICVEGWCSARGPRTQPTQPSLVPMLAREPCAAAAREPRAAARAGMRGGDGAPWVVEPLHPRVLVIPHLRPRKRHRRPALPRAGPAAGQRAPFPARAPPCRQGAGSSARSAGGREGRVTSPPAAYIEMLQAARNPSVNGAPETSCTPRR